MPNYTIYSGNLKDTEHSAETRITSIKDVKIGDYLTDHHDMYGQMYYLDLYVITKITDKNVTIEKFINDGLCLYKPIRLSWIKSQMHYNTVHNGHLSNKSHGCYFWQFIKSEALDSTYLKRI